MSHREHREKFHASWKLEDATTWKKFSMKLKVRSRNSHKERKTLWKLQVRKKIAAMEGEFYGSRKLE